MPQADNRNSKDVFAEVFESGEPAKQIVEEKVPAQAALRMPLQMTAITE